MATLEHLEIIIDVIDEFEEELNRLLFKLGQVETAVQTVDPVKIEVDVRGEQDLNALLAKMGVLEGADTAGVGDFDARGGGGGRGMRSLANASEEATQGLFEMDLRMTDLHNALARLVPLILVLIGAIPAIVGALVVLAGAAIAAAAALMALTGFAALGFAVQEGGVGNLAEGLQKAWQDIQESFLDAFIPLAERLAPLFESALDGLDRFFQRVANEGDALVDFADDAADVGRWLIENVPPFLNELARFADAASDVMGQLIDAAAGVDWFGGFAAFLAQVMPAFSKFLGLTAKLIPVILDISIGFLHVTNGILMVLNVLGQLLNVLPITEEQFGLLVGGVLALVTAVLILNSSLWGLIGGALVNLGKAVASAIVGLNGMTASAVRAKIATMGLALATRALAAAIALTGIGAIAVLLGAVAGQAATASSEIDQATKSLKEFAKQSNRMSRGGNPYGSPEVGRTGGTGRSRFGGGTINMTVVNGDEETMRNQTQNALYRMERPQRAI